MTFISMVAGVISMGAAVLALFLAPSTTNNGMMVGASAQVGNIINQGAETAVPPADGRGGNGGSVVLNNASGAGVATGSGGRGGSPNAGRGGNAGDVVVNGGWAGMICTGDGGDAGGQADGKGSKGGVNPCLSALNNAATGPMVVTGSGGRGGPVGAGGNGGGAEVDSDMNGVACGGNGGDAGQADGKGGKGGVNPCTDAILRSLPPEVRAQFQNAGRGGDGGDSVVAASGTSTAGSLAAPPATPP